MKDCSHDWRLEDGGGGWERGGHRFDQQEAAIGYDFHERRRTANKGLRRIVQRRLSRARFRAE